MSVGTKGMILSGLWEGREREEGASRNTVKLERWRSG